MGSDNNESNIFDFSWVDSPPKIVDLHRQARTGNDYELRLCLLLGCNVNGLNEIGLTPLLCADYRKPSIIKKLLDAGADFRVTDSCGRQPIHYAVAFKQVESAALLLDAGSDINAEDMGQCRPLHYAIIIKSIELIAFLVERGADLNSNFLRLVEDRQTMDYLINHVPIVRNGDQGFETMSEAIRLTNAVALRRIIQLGANVNAQYEDKATPLGLVMKVNSTECAKILLDHGADVHWKNFQGANYLQIAADLGCSDEMAIMLLDRGINVNHRSLSGHSPLSNFVYAESIGMIKLLIEYGASVLGEENHTGRSNIYHLKYCNNFDEILQYLAPSIYKSRQDDVYALQFILQNERLKSSYIEYTAELKKLELVLFYENISLLDLLIKNIYVLTNYARNEDLLKAFDAKKMKKHPIYGAWLKSKFASAIERRQYHESAFIVLSDILNLRGKCYVIVIEVMRFLNDYDLREIARYVDKSVVKQKKHCMTSFLSKFKFWH